MERAPNRKTADKPDLDRDRRFYGPVWDGSSIRVLRIVAEQTKAGIAIDPNAFDLYDAVVEGKRLPPSRSVPPGTIGTTPLQKGGQPLDITIRQMLTGVKGMDGRVYFQGETPRGIAWTALAGDVNSFTAEVRRVVTQGASSNRTVRVGEVPLLRNRLVLSRRELRIQETDIVKIISGKHAGTVTEEQLGRAVALLADPVFVLKSGAIDGALVAVLDDVDSKGDFLVAAIHPAQGTVTFHGLKSL